MPKQPKLTDLQLILLSTATQHEDGSLLPFADSIKGDDSRTTKAVQALMNRGLVNESEIAAQAPFWRQEEDRRFGLFITPEGKNAIGAGEGEEGDKGEEAPAPPPAPPAGRKPGEVRAGTKQALLVEMLEREEGATIQQIVDATGWLPHTTRAALTGLRKRGFAITSEKVDGASRYRATRAG
jgi:hypothetical protein